MKRIALGSGFLFVAASIGLAAPAAAQMYGPPGGAGPGPGAGGYYGRPYGPPSAESVDRNLAALRSRLAITPAQESAWEGFANAVRQQTRQMQTLAGNLRRPGATAPERLTQVAEVMQQRAAGMSAVAQAMTKLYAVLTQEQRTIVDEEFPAPPTRPGMGGGPPIR